MAADVVSKALGTIGLLWRGKRAEDPYSNPRAERLKPLMAAIRRLNVATEPSSTRTTRSIACATGCSVSLECWCGSTPSRTAGADPHWIRPPGDSPPTGLRAL